MGSIGVFGLSVKEAQAKIQKKVKEANHLSAAEVARDEDFWFPVQQAFNIDRSIINLNKGGVHPAPQIVMDAIHRYLDFANGAPVLNSWRYLRPRKELIRKKLACASRPASTLHSASWIYSLRLYLIMSRTGCRVKVYNSLLNRVG